jgi:cell division protein FtsB
MGPVAPAKQADNPRTGKIINCALRRRNLRLRSFGRTENVKTEKRESVIPKADPNVTARRVMIWIYAGIFAGVALLSGMFFFQTYQEYAQLRRVEAGTRQRLAQAEQRMKEQEKVLDRLRSDPAFVRQIIRLQLRYAKPSELIFRFEQ